MGKISGGCCGMVVGCALVVAAAIALVATGIYWWFHPESRERSFQVSEQAWETVRTEIGGMTARHSEPPVPPPEPEIPELPVRQ